MNIKKILGISNKKNKMIIVFALIILVYSSMNVHADNLDSFQVDKPSSNGWCFLPYPQDINHKGHKECTYRFDDNVKLSPYIDIINNGISLWGDLISLKYSPTSTDGLFTVSDLIDTNANAMLRVTEEYELSHHIAYWVITIYPINFDLESHSIEGKSKTIAHEVGHAYGLGDLYSEQDKLRIMYGYYSEARNITRSDQIGMEVVTHSHLHSSGYDKTYISLDSTKHKLICVYCSGYNIESHSFGNWEPIDDKIENQVCVCGYEQTKGHVFGVGHWQGPSMTCENGIWEENCTSCFYIKQTRMTSHTNIAATCTTPAKCTRCGVTSGNPLYHSNTAATCTTPAKCTRCGVTSGNPLYHSNTAATCTTPAKCTRCGVITSSALNHSWGSWLNYNSALHKRICTRCKTAQTGGHYLGANKLNCGACGRRGPFATPQRIEDVF